MRSVMVVSPYPKDMAPSQRLKYEQYFDYLTAQGYEFEIRPFVSTKFSKIVHKKGFYFGKIWFLILAYFGRIRDLWNIRKYDIVYIHLWVTPIGPPLFEFLFCAFAKKVIYDIDDLIFLKGTKSAANSIVNFIKGRRKPVYLMKKANHVITCTPYLDAFVKKYNQKTTDISSTVNTDDYVPKNNYDFAGGQMIIGWSGSHSTSKYVYLLKDVFWELKNSGINYKLLVMGDDSFHLPGIPFEAIPWSKEKEIEVIRSFDIGLYPLPDIQWILGKSSLKAIQYMSVGVPTIASALGTTSRVIDHGVNGFLVKNNREWVETIINLYNDKQLRSSIGRKAVEKIENYYSVNANKDTYLRILNNVFEE